MDSDKAATDLVDYLSRLAKKSKDGIVVIHLIDDFDYFYRMGREEGNPQRTDFALKPLSESNKKFMESADSLYGELPKVSIDEASKLLFDIAESYSGVELVRFPTDSELNDYKKVEDLKRIYDSPKPKPYGHKLILQEWTKKFHTYEKARAKLVCEVRITEHLVPNLYKLKTKKTIKKHNIPVRLAYNPQNHRLYSSSDSNDYMTIKTPQIRFLLDTLWETPSHSMPSYTLWDMFKKDHKVRKGDDPIEEFKSSINKFNPQVADRFKQEEAMVRSFITTRDPEENTIALNVDVFDFTSVK